jgi:hypothetical protein
VTVPVNLSRYVPMNKDEKKEAVRRTTRLFEELNQIIMEWDPYGLSQSGQMSDEFSDEVWQVLSRLPATATEEQIIQVVADVFGQSFSKAEFHPESCETVGARIAEWWLRA